MFVLLSVLHGVEQLDDSFGGFGPVRGLSRPVVGFVGDGVEVVLAVSGKVCALGEVLAQQAVGVLVGVALPWAVRVAEVDLHVQGGGDSAMQGRLAALVPGVLLQCLFSRLISIFPQCGQMVFPGLVIMQSVM